jgi:hypothetical protein
MKLPSSVWPEFPVLPADPDTTAAPSALALVDLDEVLATDGELTVKEVRIQERRVGELWRNFHAVGRRAAEIYWYVLETSEVVEFEEGLRSLVSGLFRGEIGEFTAEFQGVRKLWVTRKEARLENTTISDWKLWHEQGIKFSNPLLGTQGGGGEEESEMRNTQTEIREWNKENGREGKPELLVLEIEDLTHAKSMEMATSTISGSNHVFSLLDVIREDCIKCGRLPRLVSYEPFDRSQRRAVKISAFRTEFEDGCSGCTVKFEVVMSGKIVQDKILAVVAGLVGKFEVEIVGLPKSNIRKLRWTGENWTYIEIR